MAIKKSRKKPRKGASSKKAVRGTKKTIQKKKTKSPGKKKTLAKKAAKGVSIKKAVRSTSNTIQKTTTKALANNKTPTKKPAKDVSIKKAVRNPKKTIQKKTTKAPGKKSLPKKAIKKGGVTLKGISKIMSPAAFNTEGDVKQRIITNSPLGGIQVEDLTNDMTLTNNLSYQAANKAALTISLDRYVNDRDSSKHITASDMSSVTTVGQIVTLVKTKLNEN